MDEFEIEREFDERQMYSQKMSEYDDEYSEQKYGVLNDNFRIINVKCFINFHNTVYRVMYHQNQYSLASYQFLQILILMKSKTLLKM